eukprot:SAG11_NODE_274_length_11310_cov_4.717510_13_plen_173_part_00
MRKMRSGGRRPKTPSLEALLLQMEAESAEQTNAKHKPRRPVLSSSPTLGDAEAYRKWQARQPDDCPRQEVEWPQCESQCQSLSNGLMPDPNVALLAQDTAELFDQSSADKANPLSFLTFMWFDPLVCTPLDSHHVVAHFVRLDEADATLQADEAGVARPAPADRYLAHLRSR